MTTPADVQAEALHSVDMEAQLREVLTALECEPDGWTNDELQLLLGYKQGAISGHLGRLQERNLVMSSGKRRQGIDPRSKAQTVWVLGPGREAFMKRRRAKLAKFPTEWLREELRLREAEA